MEVDGAGLCVDDSGGFEFVFSIDSITPHYGSRNGGTDILMTGRGFTQEHKVVSVMLGDVFCPIKEVISST